MPEPALVISTVQTEALSEAISPFFCFNEALVTVLPLPLNGKPVQAASAYSLHPTFGLAPEVARKE